MIFRVLHVNASSCIAGAENSLLQLLQGLSGTEFEPAVALPGPGPLQDELRRRGVPVLFVPLRRAYRTWNPARLAAMAAATAGAAAAVARYARHAHVALIHAQGTSAMPAAGLAARFAGLPCVWHVRGLRHIPVLNRRLARLAAAVIAVSGSALAAAGIADRRGLRTCVIPNAIDADGFAAGARPDRIRAELRLAAEDRLLLAAAQLVPWKGHRDFLTALARVREREPRVVAAIAGADLFGDHPGYEDELRGMARSLGLAGEVRFLGYRTDMADLMAAADLLVVPSDAEPFGRVALEAMAVGRPVVGRARGGLPEVVEDGVTGRLTADDSPEGLAEAICEVLADPVKRRAMGDAGHRRVREAFGLPEHADRVAEVYRDCLRRAVRLPIRHAGCIKGRGARPGRPVYPSRPTCRWYARETERSRTATGRDPRAARRRQDEDGSPCQDRDA